MNIPARHTTDIFEILSKGKFICSNAVDITNNKLFDVIQDNFEELYDYFMAIGFMLEKGDEYFYFSRNEIKAQVESKIETAYKWVDIVDFFMAFNNSFAPGFRFTIPDILVQVKIDASLKDKLDIMKRLTGDGNHQERITGLVEKQLVGPGYAELENEITGQYKVLTSFNYMKDFIISIQIQEDATNEIPE